MTEPPAAASAGRSASGPAPQPGSAAQRDGGDGPDWTDQVTDLIVDKVDQVRAHTTGPILEVSKGMVYAVVALLIALPIAVVALIGLVRLITIWVPAWATYLGFGIIFVIAGVAMWSKRGRVPT